VRKAPLAIFLAILLAATAFAERPGRIGRALVTFYWLIDESAPRYRGGPRVALLDLEGRVIVRASRKFERDIVMEGSGQLRDGRTVAFVEKVHGKNRFRLTISRYGYGSLGCALIPYRTAAVDPHFIKLGSTIYIPQMKGARLPDGTIHDGIFVADDHGHFHGRQVDIFTGLGPKASRPFARRGYGSRSHVTVYLVGGATPDDCLRRAKR
jgi:3D (Asp-Asp-Asp) domain-containing protein